MANINDTHKISVEYTLNEDDLIAKARRCIDYVIRGELAGIIKDSIQKRIDEEKIEIPGLVRKNIENVIDHEIQKNVTAAVEASIKSNIGQLLYGGFSYANDPFQKSEFMLGVKMAYMVFSEMNDEDFETFRQSIKESIIKESAKDICHGIMRDRNKYEKLAEAINKEGE